MFIDFIWRLPAKILNSVCSPVNSSMQRSYYSLLQNEQENEPACRKSPRRRPLHTCGSSCLSIARKACKKAQNLDGHVGSMTKTSINLFNSFFPFINGMVHQSLSILLIVDDQILSIESKIERLVPRSACLFDGLDRLVCSAEALPDQLDDIMNKLPSIIHRFPLLDWIVAHLIWFLNILLSILAHLGSKNGREKEIGVDCCKGNAVEHTKTVQFEKPYSYADAARNHTEIQKPKAVPTEVIHLSVKRLHSWKTRIKALEEPLSAGDSPMYSSFQSANSSPVSDCSQDENHPFSQLGCSYKEILERDKKEEDEVEEDKVENVKEEDSKCYIATELVN